MSYLTTGLAHYLQKEYREAHTLFSCGSESGDADATFYLGLTYFYGQYVQKDIVRAITFFEEAANADCEEASFQLAQIYLFGCGDIEPDKTKAFDNMLKSAELNYVPATVDLAWMYFKGIGVEKNYNKSLKWAKTPGIIYPFPWWKLSEVPDEAFQHQIKKIFLRIILNASWIFWKGRSVLAKK
jgi:hypothetical protein